MTEFIQFLCRVGAILAATITAAVITVARDTQPDRAAVILLFAIFLWLVGQGKETT